VSRVVGPIAFGILVACVGAAAGLAIWAIERALCNA